MTETELDVSFVIPARDEELLIGATIHSIASSVCAFNLSSEVIVVDDASRDATAEIAADCGARVVAVKLHNIGAVRNAGARTARGRLLVFLDADTQFSAKTLKEILVAVQGGAIGGGASVLFDDGTTWVQRILAGCFVFLWQRVCGWAAGCCMFATRDAFEQIGGFDETRFAAEEKHFSTALRKRGQFVIVKSAVTTSARKLRLFTTWYLARTAIVTLLFGGTKRREGLEILYDAPREQIEAQK